MQTTGKIFDDFARVAGGAAGAFSGIRDEVETLVKSRLERVLADMDVVPRDEFDAIKAVAVKARAEQEKLEARVAALEEALKNTTPAKQTKTARARKPKADSAD